MTTWQYYDIRANWPKFYEIWPKKNYVSNHTKS